MKKISKMAMLILCVMMITPVLMSCVAKKSIYDNSIIRYQKIEIPFYYKNEYERMIYSEEEDIRYNSICNLIVYADDYAEVLSQKPNEDQKSMEKIELKKAKKIFEFMVTQLNHKNKKIIAASIIFLTKFASKYSKKEDLVKVFSGLKLKDPMVQYEQIKGLIQVSSLQSDIDKGFIESYLNSSSWLIKSMTYLLLSKIDSKEHHKQLIKELNNTKQEYDQLLIINTFKNGFGNQVFKQLKKVLATTDNKKVITQITSILKMHSDINEVVDWLLKEYQNINDEIIKAVIDGYYFEIKYKKGAEFFIQLIQSNKKELLNLIDYGRFFSEIYYARENLEKEIEIQTLSKTIIGQDWLNKKWITFRKNKEEELLKVEESKKREKELTSKYNVLLKKHLEATKVLFADQGMKKDEIEESTEFIKEMLKLMKDEKKN